MWLQRHLGSGLRARALQWAPSLDAQNPSPPVPLVGFTAAAEGRATAALALRAADHEPAVAFDAAADALQLTGGSFPANNSDYTISVWVRRKAGTQDPSFIIENDAAGTTLALALNANVPGLLNGSGFIWNVTIGSALLADVWYFLAMRVSGTTGTITRGGETEPCTHASGTIVAQAAPFRMWFGGTTSTFFPTADLAMIRCWNRVLTDGELELERQSASPVSREKLAGDFRLASAAVRGADVYSRQHLTSPGVGPWATTDGPTLGRDTIIEGSVVGTATASADLDTAPASGISFSAVGTATAAAALTTSISLAAAATGTATATASLSTAIQLAASATGTATASAALTTSIRLTAAPVGTATASVALTTAVQLVASATGTATATAALTTSIQLTAAPVGVATVAFTLTTSGGSLVANATGTASASASLTTSISLAAAAVGTATASASITTSIRLAAPATGTATASAALSTSITMAAAAAGAATASCALDTRTQFAGDVSSTATAVADLQTAILLLAAAAGTATATMEFSSLGPAPAGLFLYAGDVGAQAIPISGTAEVVPIGSGGATVEVP